MIFWKNSGKNVLLEDYSFMKKLPSISIVTGTWNPDLRLFERVLKNIQLQEYPKKLLEHIVFDAGSTNGTVELAKKYDCKVTIRGDLKEGEQIRQSLEISQAQGDIILLLQSDNILPTKTWLKEMIQPFIENKNVFCTFSAYNSYEKNMSATTRYGAFFGAGDPTLYYLGKSDKIPLLEKKYDKGTVISETAGYWVVKFTKDTLPTMGDNGHMVRRSIMEKVNKDPKAYIHVDIFVDMLEMGHNTCAVVKNSIVHVIGQSIFTYAKRRLQVKQKFYDGKRGKRKYLVFNWKSNRDRLNLIKFVFFSLTFIIPLGESIRGYVKIRDNAWFLHPLLCLIMLFTYGISELKWVTKRAFR